MAKKSQNSSDENLNEFKGKNLSFTEELKLKIADKIVNLISDLIDKSVMLSASRIKAKIIEIENAIIRFFKYVLVQYSIKITLIIIGIIFLFLGAFKLAIKYYPEWQVFLALGVIALILSMFFRAKPYVNLN